MNNHHIFMFTEEEQDVLEGYTIVRGRPEQEKNARLLSACCLITDNSSASPRQNWRIHSQRPQNIPATTQAAALTNRSEVLRIRT
jgi:hypothetical protein